MSIISNISENERKYWLALSTFEKFGPKSFSLLDAYFKGNMEYAFKGSINELATAGINKKVAEEFIEHRKKVNPDAEKEKIAKYNIKIITIKDKEYPTLLKQIYGPPATLYYKGKWPENIGFCLAVVGSRKYTSYGKQAVEHFTRPLARAGLVITSGLALGIDALAHLACLKENGATIGVLGSGLGQIYPASNRYISEKILNSNGLIISEYPLNSPPLSYHFPQRNRIISGLSLGTLIIEASIKSGASITAKLALEQGREVFAVPGSVFNPNSEGTNNLIKEGARPVSSAEEIIEALELKNIKSLVKARQASPQTPQEEKILSVLTREPSHANAIARDLKLDTATINATLLTMELKGMIRNLGGGNYVLS